MILLKGSAFNQTYVFVEGFCWSQGTDMTTNDFSAFQDIRRCKKLDSQDPHPGHPDRHPELLQVSEGQQPQPLWFQPHRADGRCQCLVSPLTCVPVHTGSSLKHRPSSFRAT